MSFGWSVLIWGGGYACVLSLHLLVLCGLTGNILLPSGGWEALFETVVILKMKTWLLNIGMIRGVC